MCIKPSGFAASEASLATNFVGATPTDATRPVSLRMSRLIERAMASPSPNKRWQPRTSRNASSSESGSTRGVYERKIRMICWLTLVYFSKSGGSISSAPCGI